MRAVLLATVLVLGELTAVRAASPSLKATQQWLKARIPQHVIYTLEDGKSYSRTIEVRSLEKCELIFTDLILVGGETRATRYEVNLKSLDPQHHEIQPMALGVWWLWVPTTGDAKVRACLTEACEAEVFHGGINLVFGDAQMPKRVSKALAHAIRLCGGASDIF